MPTVGAVTVEILRGNAAPLAQRVDVWFVPGLNTPGAQLLGVNQSAFAFNAVLYGSESTVETRLSALHAIQGTVVTITDDHSRTRLNCLVTSVGVPDRKRVEREGSTEVRAQVSIAGIRTA